MFDRNVLSTIKKAKNTIIAITATFMTLGGVVISYTQFVYQLGIETQRNNTGVELGNSFDLNSIALEEELNLDERTVNFKNIYLVEFRDPVIEKQNRVIYKIRKLVDTAAVTQEIGTILTKKQPNQTNSLLKELWQKVGEAFAHVPPDNFLIDAAYAQENFNWYGRQNNYNFYEKYIDRFTIRRYYDDGWILEYKVDATGWSISDSFRWIEKKMGSN